MYLGHKVKVWQRETLEFRKAGAEVIFQPAIRVPWELLRHCPTLDHDGARRVGCFWDHEH